MNFVYFLQILLMCLGNRSHIYFNFWHRAIKGITQDGWPPQGLTQTFMSSGPQDHQLRGSSGPTIFLVVLTTTTLVNLETIFFTCMMCFHMINFVKPQHG